MSRKEEVEELWRTCFGDPENFIRLYFDRVYCDENTLTIQENGKIVSALQMLPYTMTYMGSEIPVAYISGACTAPEARGKGLMRRLLQTSFEEMARRGVALTALIPAEPWLFDYYRQLGYTETFDYAEESYLLPTTLNVFPDVRVSRPSHSDPELYAYFNRKLSERRMCIQHTYKDFNTIFLNFQLDNDGIYIAKSPENHIVGMVFAYVEEIASPSNSKRRMVVKELFYESDAAKEALIQEITLRNNAMEAVVKVPPTRLNFHQFGMARVIDRKRMIRLWLSGQSRPAFSQEELSAMEPQTLTYTLMNYPEREAYMSLMLD